MGLFKILKKKVVPNELPSLNVSNSQSLNNNFLLSQEGNGSKNFEVNPFTQEEIKTDNLDIQPKYKPLPVQKLVNIEKPQIQSGVLSEAEKAILQKETETEKGFFKKLIKDFTHEINSEKLNQRYKEKILSEDIVNQMRGYWENQKPEIFLKNAGSELKQQLLIKAEKLNSLEKEWQNAYFSLIAKEEKIRQEEKELKRMLSELINIYEESLERNKLKKKGL